MLTVAVALTVASAFVAPACGDDESAAGGTFTVGLTAPPDALDPALSFSPEVWESLWLVYTPLLTYTHVPGGEGTELVPGLAEDLPEVSDGGTRYELRLREGLEYSDGTPVRASDFEHAVKRVLALESPGVPFFSGIAGAEDYLARPQPGGDIEGIETDDATGEIAIELEAPDSSFANVLAMTFAGLVPEETPMRPLTSDPPPGAGPYAIASVDGREGFVLEANERFEAGEIPSGEVDRIAVEVVTDPTRATQDVIGGELDYITNPPAPDQLAEVRERYSDRFDEFTTLSIYYFFMNPNLPPFDDAEVRKAVNHAIDQRAIVRLFGGLMDPTCNVIPPDVPGYVPIEPCPYGDPEGPPNVEKARALVEQAGATGEEVTVWGSSEPEPRRTTEYLADVLDRIGLDAEPRIIGPSLYFQTVGAERTESQIGFANYFLDFPHPGAAMTIVDGDAVERRATPNLGRVQDPKLTAQIERLRQEPNLSEVADQWADVDRHVLRDAWIAPFGHRELTTFVSERVAVDDVMVHPVYGHDYTTFQLDE